MTYSQKVKLRQNTQHNKGLMIAFIIGILIGSFSIKSLNHMVYSSYETHNQI